MSNQSDLDELVQAIVCLNNEGDNWNEANIKELVLVWHNKQVEKARLNEVQNAYEHWINGRKFISSYFRQRIEALQKGEL